MLTHVTLSSALVCAAAQMYYTNSTYGLDNASRVCYTVRTEAMEYAMPTTERLVTEAPLTTETPMCQCRQAQIRFRLELNLNTVERCETCFAYYMAGFIGKKVTVYVNEQ